MIFIILMLFLYFSVGLIVSFLLERIEGVPYIEGNNGGPRFTFITFWIFLAPVFLLISISGRTTLGEFKLYKKIKTKIRGF